MVAGAMSVQSSVVVPTDSLDDLSISSSVVDAILNTLSSGESSEAVYGLTASMSEVSNSQLPYTLSEEAVYDRYGTEESSVMSVASSKASYAEARPTDRMIHPPWRRLMEVLHPLTNDNQMMEMTRENEAVSERDGEDVVSLASSKVRQGQEQAR